MFKTADISPCGKYRYKLTRVLSGQKKSCLFIMLNPSTADANKDDPTIKRCMGFASKFECGHLIVVNLFAYRATDPEQLWEVEDPVGPRNMEVVKEAAEWVGGGGDRYGMPPKGPVICAWGNHGAFMDQANTVLGWLECQYVKPQCLKLNQPSLSSLAGMSKPRQQPAHPLYLPKTSELLDFDI